MLAAWRSDSVLTAWRSDSVLAAWWPDSVLAAWWLQVTHDPQTFRGLQTTTDNADEDVYWYRHADHPSARLAKPMALLALCLRCAVALMALRRRSNGAQHGALMALRRRFAGTMPSL